MDAPSARSRSYSASPTVVRAIGWRCGPSSPVQACPSPRAPQSWIGDFGIAGRPGGRRRDVEPGADRESGVADHAQRLVEKFGERFVAGGRHHHLDSAELTEQHDLPDPLRFLDRLVVQCRLAAPEEARQGRVDPARGVPRGEVVGFGGLLIGESLPMSPFEQLDRVLEPAVVQPVQAFEEVEEGVAHADRAPSPLRGIHRRTDRRRSERSGRPWRRCSTPRW